MKRSVILILALCMVLALAACANKEVAPTENTTPATAAPTIETTAATIPEETTPAITMQEIQDANKTEVLLKNYQSISLREELDGECFSEVYLTNDYIFSYIPGAELDWMEFIADNVSYCLAGSDNVCYVFITPDGVGSFADTRAERSATADLTADAADHIIESVSEENGRITVKTSLNEEALAANAEEFGVTSAKSEYLLDAETYEIISITNELAYDDGTVYCIVTEVAYDAEAPELLKTILAYETQTEDLRNVTIVSNPGTEKEETKSLQLPKGLIFGFQFDDAFENAVEFYTDAACTEAYDPYAGTDADLTVYIKWVG